MSLDATTLPFGPGVVLTGLAYAALSAFVTGPEIAEREIERSLWPQVCEVHLAGAIEATRAPKDYIPNVPNPGKMICSVYPELNFLCDMMPDPNAGAIEIARRKQALEDARIARATEGVRDRCSCASQVYMEEEKVGLALYAASGRFFESQAIKHRDAALTRALQNPICAGGLGQ